MRGFDCSRSTVGILQVADPSRFYDRSDGVDGTLSDIGDPDDEVDVSTSRDPPDGSLTCR